MDNVELLQRFSVALAIGLVIGIERGWHAREQPEGGRAAGLRTHALASLVGASWGAIAQSSGDGGAVALGLAFIAFGAAIIIFRYRETEREGTFGATTVVAAMLAFSLGAFAVLGNLQIAAASGVAAAGLLALKRVLHDWVRRLSWEELRSGLLLLAMTCILLPVLPNRAIDPWGAVNPFQLWLMTVMIAVISFIGYVAIKLAGGRNGILILGVAGGLTSSTAVTMHLAKLAGIQPEGRTSLLAGITLSWATLMIRVLIIASIINVALLSKLAAPLVLAAVTLTCIALYLLRKPVAAALKPEIALTNPLELRTVLIFGSALTVITIAAKIATSYAGDAGAYAVAAVSGVADVDAVTLSMLRLARGDLAASVAERAIFIVVAVNTISKACLAWAIGGTEVGKKLFAISIAAIAAGICGYQLSSSF